MFSVCLYFLAGDMHPAGSGSTHTCLHMYFIYSCMRFLAGNMRAAGGGSSSSSREGGQPGGGTAQSSSGQPVHYKYQMLSQTEFEARNGVKATVGKRYFAHTALADIVANYPLRQNMRVRLAVLYWWPWFMGCMRTQCWSVLFFSNYPELQSMHVRVQCTWSSLAWCVSVHAGLSLGAATSMRAAADDARTNFLLVLTCQCVGPQSKVKLSSCSSAAATLSIAVLVCRQNQKHEARDRAALLSRPSNMTSDSVGVLIHEFDALIHLVNLHYSRGRALMHALFLPARLIHKSLPMQQIPTCLVLSVPSVAIPTQDEDIIRERINRESFTDFLRGVLDVDPRTRWTPRQAAGHPFVRGTPYRGPYQPQPGVCALLVGVTVLSVACVCMLVSCWSFYLPQPYLPQPCKCVRTVS